MAVDFLILAADSAWGGDFHASYKKVKEDVRSVHMGMYEFHTHLGMRVLGPSKIAWIARKHGYSSQVLSKLQMLSKQEIISLCEKFVDHKTIIGLSTSLLGYPHGNYTAQSFRESTLQSESAIYKLLSTLDHFRNKFKSKNIRKY